MHFLVTALALSLCLATAHAELQPEPIPNVITLQTPYPGSHALVHDFAFGSLIDSSFSLVDVNTRKFRGMLSAGQFATVDVSVKRQKYYVGETVHTRGARGTRQDVVAVYDFANLALIKEIDLPPKRMNVVVNKSSTAITSDERFLLIFNMNPATSVTVIDLDTEAVVSEIPTPGCALVYPDLKGGFFTLCGNGGLTAIRLTDTGLEQERWSSAVFNDIDADPLSEKGARIKGVWQLVTYKGEVQPVDARGARPKIGKRWWLTTPEERAANWRPAGWHGKAGHDNGRLWVAMSPDGYEGSHKDPASHIWVFDAPAGKRISTFELRVPALSIEVTGQAQPKLLVVNVEGALDVYDATSGAYVHSIHALGETPYMVHAVD